jgi:hypothetical protein
MAEESKPPQVALADAIHLLQTFRGADLTRTIYQIEFPGRLPVENETEPTTHQFGRLVPGPGVLILSVTLRWRESVLPRYLLGQVLAADDRSAPSA